MSLPTIRHAALRSAPLLAALWFAASAAHAQSANETRLRDALRDTASRLRTAEAALAQQQAATAAAERERDELKTRTAKPAAAADGAQLVALQQRLGQAAAAAEQARGEAQKWRSAQEQAAHGAQQKERERAELAQQLQASQARAAQCAAGSEALYRAGLELAQLYRDPAYAKGRRVTLLGFGQIERENRVRELENKLEDERAKTAQCAAGDAAARTAGTGANG